jgi:hypothetical protein
MCIAGDYTVTVVNNNEIAISSLPAGESDSATVSGSNGCTAAGGNI